MAGDDLLKELKKGDYQIKILYLAKFFNIEREMKPLPRETMAEKLLLAH